MAVFLGIKGHDEVLVTEANVAQALGSGSLPVFSTPALIISMEKAALESVQPYLDEGSSTVGVRLEADHLAATPIGMTVRTESELTGIDGRIQCNAVKKEQRRALLQLLKHFTVEIHGPRPVEEAIVTAGGVKVSEINPKTMESKLLPGLYFAGEVIDVDAYTGGFNMQIAWSTGYAAGRAAAIKQEL